MVVLGSWDALVERYLAAPHSGDVRPDRSELERILLDPMAGGPVFLVLVLVRTEPSGSTTE